MIDPRIEMIKHKISKIKNILLFISGKGGVGKSLISSAVSYALSEKGYGTAYLDLDLHGPSGQNLFPLDTLMEGGKDGLKTALSGKVKVASIGYMVKDNPLPLSGLDRMDILLDFFSILDLGELEFLVVDLPPGMGEETIFLQRMFREKLSAIVVTLNSRMSFSTVKRVVNYLKTQKINIIGAVVNMSDLFGRYNPEHVTREIGVEIIGSITYHPEIEEYKTIKDKLRNTPRFMSEIEELVEKILGKLLKAKTNI